MDNKVRTVSDTKRDFYNHHARPINSIYRRVVEELMVEMHLLSVNTDFQTDPIYLVGVVTAFQRFMQGYKPESDIESIFNALCQSVGGDPQKYKQEAESTIALAKTMSVDEFIAWLANPTQTPGGEHLAGEIAAISQNAKFKYSRLFAIGLYSLLEEQDAELIKDSEKRDRALKQIAESLHLPAEKMQKDLDIHRGNLDKMSQLISVLDDVLRADRKQREQRTQETTTAE